jgi:hypothetical protein
MSDGNGSDPLPAPVVPSPVDVTERRLLDASVELIEASNCESVAQFGRFRRGTKMQVANLLQSCGPRGRQLTDTGHALL